MKISLLLLTGIIKIVKADHVLLLGTGLPPATVGPGIPITPFTPDARPLFASVNTVQSGLPSGEVITFNNICSHRRVGNGWATWSHDYTGDVYFANGATSLAIGLPISTTAFVFYVEPDPFAVYSFTVTYSGGGSITESINGAAGAKGFAVFEHDGLGSPTGVSISSTVSFAVGEFYMGVNPPPVAVCDDPVTLVADANCQADVVVDINNGSYDPDGDALTISQSHQAPFSLGETSVVLTVSDGRLSDSCTTTVTVTNDAPHITPLDDSIVFVDGADGSPDDNGLLSAAGSDPEGQVLTYLWTTDCPGATIVDADTASPTLSIATATSPGICEVSVTVCDICGGCTTVTGAIIIVDPAIGFVTGGGFIQSPEQAYFNIVASSGKANYGFIAKYKKGSTTPSGHTSFVFEEADLKFTSTSYEWLVITGSGCAKFKGVGTINGEAQSYGFILTACDDGEGGNAGDTFRIQINGVYDNLVDPDDVASYDGTVIGGGNIQAHPPKLFNLRG